MSDVRFVAEVSSNHNRDLERSLQFIDAAAASGCTAVKFQLFRIERLFAPEILSKSKAHRDRKRWELPVEFIPELARYSRDRGIAFCCTPFDLEAVELLEPWVDFFKVASYELLWDPLLEQCAMSGKPVVLSTGMANLEEIDHAVEVVERAGGREKLTLLHCVSGYPTPAKEANLSAIETMRDRFGCSVGWSDHTVNPGVIQRAIHRWGASMVEFHLDLDRHGEEFSAGHCWLPDQISRVIEEVSEGIGADGRGVKAPVSTEQDDRDWRADPSDGLRPLRRVRGQWEPEKRREEEKVPKVLVVTGASRESGLGHLSRSAVAARALQDHAKAGIEIIAVGERVDLPVVELLPITWVDERVELVDLITSKRGDYNTLLFDLKEDQQWRNLIDPVLKEVREEGVVVVALDGWAALEPLVDLFWFPSFYLPEAIKSGIPEQKRYHGWDSYLLQRSMLGEVDPKDPPRDILVSLGGSDLDGLGDALPPLLQQMPAGTRIHWVQGPYADPPTTVEGGAVEWRVYRSPSNLVEIYCQCDVALVSYGVTLFELLVLGKPVVALRTSAGPVDAEWRAFINEEVAVTAENAESAVDQLMQLIMQPQWMRGLSCRFRKLFGAGGGERLALEVVERVMARYG